MVTLQILYRRPGDNNVNEEIVEASENLDRIKLYAQLTNTSPEEAEKRYREAQTIFVYDKNRTIPSEIIKLIIIDQDVLR